jgi:hypothetical protein
MGSRRLSALIPLILVSTLASAAVSMAVPAKGTSSVFDSQENKAWISSMRQSQFSPIPHPAAYASCEISDPPVALATPDPLVEFSNPESKITVSFIVGTDGHVHSLYILDGDTPTENGTVIRALRSWRYRPARCNGVPIDAEARIQFRLH